MSNRICFQLLYLRSAAVPGGSFSKCPAERKAVAVASNVRRPHNHDSFKVIGGLSADSSLFGWQSNISSA